jgi:hypothetical protein
MKSEDLMPKAFPPISWKPGALSSSLEKLFEYITGRANGKITWYFEKRALMRLGARFFRGGAITNGDQCAGGWKLNVENAPEELRKGNHEVAKTNIEPGIQKVRASGMITGHMRQIEKAVIIRPAKLPQWI